MSALVLALALGAGDGHLLRLRALDAATRIVVAARAEIAPARSPAFEADLRPLEDTEVAVAPGRVEVRVRADGYRPLSATFTIAPGIALPVTFELDSLSPPAEVRALPATTASTAVVHGYVVAADIARPVAGAEVALPQMDLRTSTDAGGYFRLTLPAPPRARSTLLTTLRISAPGYALHEVAGLLIAPGATLLREALAPGDRATSRDDTPRALMVSGAAAAPPDAARGADEPAGPAAEGNALVPLDPPASIRVGTSCSCSTCTGVSVLSLETYVKRGLNDEWIASWNGHSLRAGAVAYRAYGTWYTQHPISGAYDICNTTCCQVNDTDTSSATDAAVDRTAGYLLERGAAVFRAEYSAENNAWDDPDDGLSCSNADLSCGGGSAGSPAAGWSCLIDGVDATHGCFGHGRGACQWGTQRWSLQGRRWNWILDHYYNDHGAGTGLRTAHVSTPLVLLQAAAPPRVLRGATFTLTVRASNRATVAHARVLLGASLHMPGGQLLSDPAHDAALVLPPGDSDRARAFTVRTPVKAGSYDLLVSLYDDVDEDGLITNGVDLPLQLLVMPGAVEVCATPSCLERGLLPGPSGR